MSFGERLTELRKGKGFTRESFAEYLGISKYTLRNYELSINDPGSTFLKQISDIFNVSIDYLLCLTDEREKVSSYKLKSSEYEHIEKYRSLDAYGRETVDITLDRELKRTSDLEQKFIELAEQAELISDRDKRIADLESSTQNIINIGAYTEHLLDRTFEYHHSASAGGGVFMLDDEGVEQVAIPAETPGADKCDYLIKISGNSMEPDYYDGEVALVSRIMPVRHGDVGIFVVDGKAYIKEYGDTELISRNPSSENIKISEYANIVCMGKVVGKIREEDMARK